MCAGLARVMCHSRCHMVSWGDSRVRLLHATRMWRESLLHTCHHFERRLPARVDVGLRQSSRSQYVMRFNVQGKGSVRLFPVARAEPTDQPTRSARQDAVRWDELLSPVAIRRSKVAAGVARKAKIVEQKVCVESQKNSLRKCRVEIRRRGVAMAGAVEMAWRKGAVVGVWQVWGGPDRRRVARGRNDKTVGNNLHWGQIEASGRREQNWWVFVLSQWVN